MISSGLRATLRMFCRHINAMESMLTPPRRPRPPLWRLPLIAALLATFMVLLWISASDAPAQREAEAAAAQAASR